MKQKTSKKRAIDTPERREIQQEEDRLKHQRLNAGMAAFKKAINTLCDTVCEV